MLDLILVSLSRYTSRYFLKHTILEQAFDQLCAAGFRYIHKEIIYKLSVSREMFTMPIVKSKVIKLDKPETDLFFPQNGGLLRQWDIRPPAWHEAGPGVRGGAVESLQWVCLPPQVRVLPRVARPEDYSKQRFSRVFLNTVSWKNYIHILSVSYLNYSWRFFKIYSCQSRVLLNICMCVPK